MTDQLDVRTKCGAFLIARSTCKRRRHDTFSAAEREAERLLTTDPDGTYVIMREEARVSRRREGAHGR